jgi:hypothetical protein
LTQALNDRQFCLAGAPPKLKLPLDDAKPLNKFYMSKIKNNNVLSGVSGMLGDNVVIRRIRGKQQLANKPAPSDKKASPKQAAVQARFRAAISYAKDQIANEEIKVLYQTGMTNKKHSAYLVAMNDFLNPPVVSNINVLDYTGEAGSTVTLTAIDDFMVTKVKVRIFSADGTLLEQGDATQEPLNKQLWKYEASKANLALPGTIIRAYAFDRPGNTGSGEVTL